MEKSTVVIKNATISNQTATSNQLYHYTVGKRAFAKPVHWFRFFTYIHVLYIIYTNHKYIHYVY